MVITLAGPGETLDKRGRGGCRIQFERVRQALTRLSVVAKKIVADAGEVERLVPLRSETCGSLRHFKRSILLASALQKPNTQDQNFRIVGSQSQSRIRLRIRLRKTVGLIKSGTAQVMLLGALCILD